MIANNPYVGSQTPAAYPWTQIGAPAQPCAAGGQAEEFVTLTSPPVSPAIRRSIMLVICSGIVLRWKTEQRALLRPVHGSAGVEQLSSGEVWRLAPIDNCSDDVGREIIQSKSPADKRWPP